MKQNEQNDALNVSLEAELEALILGLASGCLCSRRELLFAAMHKSLGIHTSLSRSGFSLIFNKGRPDLAQDIKTAEKQIKSAYLSPAKLNPSDILAYLAWRKEVNEIKLGEKSVLVVSAPFMQHIGQELLVANRLTLINGEGVLIWSDKVPCIEALADDLESDDELDDINQRWVADRDRIRLAIDKAFSEHPNYRYASINDKSDTPFEQPEESIYTGRLYDKVVFNSERPKRRVTAHAQPAMPVMPDSEYDYTGLRRGAVTAVFWKRKTINGKSSVWVVQCDCGYYEYRIRLNRWLSKADPETDMCEVCEREKEMERGPSSKQTRPERLDRWRNKMKALGLNDSIIERIENENIDLAGNLTADDIYKALIEIETPSISE